MPDKLEPKDHAERVAIFRAQIIGTLTARELVRGELRSELKALSRTPFRPPGGEVTKRYSFSTLERWYYAFRAGGLKRLEPGRTGIGFAQNLTQEQRDLILAIAKEHVDTPVSVILRTLRDVKALDLVDVSDNTVRRYLVSQGLDAAARRQAAKGTVRRRWSVEAPGVLWHADVCHGPSLKIDGRAKPLRIHGILDDASRFVVALRAFHTEREVDMLSLFVDALRLHGKPRMLYLGRVDDRRGDRRDRGVAVAGGFRLNAGASIRPMAPFPVAARRTGRAELPHPALVSILRLSRSTGPKRAHAAHRGQVLRRGTRVDTGGIHCLAVDASASAISAAVVPCTTECTSTWARLAQGQSTRTNHVQRG